MLIGLWFFVRGAKRILSFNPLRRLWDVERRCSYTGGPWRGEVTRPSVNSCEAVAVLSIVHCPVLLNSAFLTPPWGQVLSHLRPRCLQCPRLQADRLPHRGHGALPLLLLDRPSCSLLLEPAHPPWISPETPTA